MPSRKTRHSLAALIVTAGMLLTAFSGTATAARPAAATISACQAAQLTVAGRVKLSGKQKRKARGANLQLRFQALPLFGLPRAGQWRDLGKKTSGSGQEVFTGLGADNWVGVMSWRFKRGARSVLSGDERSQPVKIGSAKGRANCTVAEGLKPTDTTPPVLYILPAPDEIWHRAPKPVQLIAQDDFSGVQGLRYAVDGGAIQAIGNGGVVSLDTEGAHTLDWAATDVAGNTATRSAVIRVDANPPTKPAITGPRSVTASLTPTISWTASTDSASGLRGYVVEISKADGSSPSVQTVDANTTSITAPPLADGDTYVARVTAVDNTDQAWGSASDQYTFRVDSKPEVTAVSPASGTILKGSLKDTNFTLTLDRPATPGTVSATLDNVDDGAGPVSASVGCTGTPCTSIVVDPAATLGEGRYSLTLGAVKSDEGVAFQPFTARYSVPFPNGDGATMSAATGGVCVQPAEDILALGTLGSEADTEQGTAEFDVTTQSGDATWTLQAEINGAAAGGNATISRVAVSGTHATLGPFDLSSGTLTLRLTVPCSSTSVQLSNVVVARVP